jgi:hypothetical protein
MIMCVVKSFQSALDPSTGTPVPFKRTRAHRPYFGMSGGFWLNLQGHCDLEVEKDRLVETLEGIEPLAAAS